MRKLEEEPKGKERERPFQQFGVTLTTLIREERRYFRTRDA